MRSDWVAATVRAKAMARRRAGAGLCREAAAQPSLDQALEVLSSTSYAADLAGARDLAAAQDATRRSVLWQLRVLAGWVPVSGARMVHAAGAAFELVNILLLARRLAESTDQSAGEDGARELHRSVPLPEYFELGGLATAWPRLSAAGSTAELAELLRTSPWGNPGSPDTMADTLTAVWLRRLAAAVPQARSWAVAEAALLAARRILVPQATGTGNMPEIPDRLGMLLQPLIGGTWSTADDVASFRAALPAAAAPVLDGVEDPTGLWRAEAALQVRVEGDAFRLLRSGLPGPDTAVGAVAVLAVDAWRMRAALAAASAGGGSEVLDAVA
ncbi:hypothetical protein [Arthrobacter sp. 7Tela_A1]|uniref:hypothetical protein n=1 Tax=Arthrobacter sp. 7Tela_A1 TaxID=3093745 RepID=UPI003BB72429